jgi:hypothetical protein
VSQNHALIKGVIFEQSCCQNFGHS